MGLRCLMGHDFGEVLTERDRRERGNEVIVTIREYRECDRCGETRTVSENKEVRRATGPEEADDGADAAVEADDQVAEGADAIDDVSAEEDDGVILVDEPEEREPGAWPETDDEEPEEDAGEPAPWPEVEGDDEGYAAEPSDGAPVEGVEFGSGLTPEAPAADESDGAPAEADGDVIESSGEGDHGGFRRSGPAPSGSGSQHAVAAETELLCPECAHTAPTENSSLRPGDICPECRLGYLTERER